MQQERLNKILQQKLDGITELPNHHEFSAATSWDKLESKLAANRTARKSVFKFKWMAAAAMLVLIITISLLKKDKPEGSFSDTSNIGKNSESNKPQILIDNQPERNIALKTQRKPDITNTTSQHLGIKKAHSLPLLIKVEEQQVLLPVEVSVATTSELQPLLEEANTTSSTQVTVSTNSKPLRKFRIVHINETISQPLPAIAKNNTVNHSSFPLFRQHFGEVNGEQIPEPDALTEFRKRGFLKTITNSIKD